MNLNLGSSRAKGKYKSRDWVNVDLYSFEGVNVRGSGFELPFKEGSFDRIHSVHVLEHLTRDKWPIMLEEMYRVLKIGGSCWVEVPDFPRQVQDMLTFYKKGDKTKQHRCRTSIYGKTEREGMAHHFGFDCELLKNAFIKIGFDDVERKKESKDMISPHHRHGPILLVVGYKKTNKQGIIKTMTFDELRDFILI